MPGHAVQWGRSRGPLGKSYFSKYYLIHGADACTSVPLKMKNVLCAHLIKNINNKNLM